MHILNWQPTFSLWRVELFGRAWWGQRRTQIWLGHVFITWLWPHWRPHWWRTPGAYESEIVKDVWNAQQQALSVLRRIP